METFTRLLPALAVVILVLAGAGLYRWLDTLGRVRGFGYGRAACGVLLLVAAGYLIASA